MRAGGGVKLIYGPESPKSGCGSFVETTAIILLSVGPSTASRPLEMSIAWARELPRFRAFLGREGGEPDIG